MIKEIATGMLLVGLIVAPKPLAEGGKEEFPYNCKEINLMVPAMEEKINQNMNEFLDCIAEHGSINDSGVVCEIPYAIFSILSSGHKEFIHHQKLKCSL